MADTDDWGGVAVSSQPDTDDWGGIAVGQPAAPKLPDMSAVRTTANDNLKITEGEKEPENEQFGPRLDRAAGFPVTSAVGAKDNDVSLSPQMRGHLADAYKNKTATDAGDFMQSAVPSMVDSISKSSVKMFPWQAQIESFAKHADEISNAFVNVNKSYISTVVYPFVSKESQEYMEQSGMVEPPGVSVKTPGNPTRAELIEAAVKGERGTLGKVMGAVFSPVVAGTTPVINPIMEAIVQKAQRDGVSAEDAKTIPGIIGVVMDAFGMHAVASGMHMAPPELKELVGKKLDKPAAQVTDNDIVAAIRMGFENNNPKAKEFDDAAALIVGPENEAKGAETLINVWSETGVTPDKVHEDAAADPQIAADVKEGKVPEIYKEKSASEKKAEAHKASEAKLIEEGRGLSNTDEALPHLRTAVNGGTEEANVAAIKWAMENGRNDIADHIIASAKRDAEASKASEKKGPTISESNPKYEEAKIALKQATKQAIERHKQFVNLAKLTEEKTGLEDSVVIKKPKVTKEERAQVIERRDLSPEHQAIENNLGIPETMSARQLTKVETELEKQFSEQAKEPTYSDEEFAALEDYGRRVEAARENLNTNPPAKQIKKIITDEEGAARIPQNVKDFGNDIKRDILNFATPMETGSGRARASAKDFANRLRWSQWNGSRVMKMLEDKFTPEEMSSMWTAMDEASVYVQKLEAEGISREAAMAKAEAENVGHFKLPEEQREVIKALSDWAQSVWDRAKALEMVEGEGLPFWTPRMAAVIGEDGAWGSPRGKGERPSVNVGKNLRTTSGNLKQRKYLTAEETEAAMQEAFGGETGEGAQLIRDIRTMPLALTRLEQAVAGRALINEIKEFGKTTGAETVADGAKEGYFTLDHPAFYKYRPKLELGEDGKWKVVNDAKGEPIFERVPIYISKEFEGPLKAVLSQDSSAAYKALMELKGKAMSLVMYSPLIHNAVEWGRALATMPGKVLTFKVYFEGNRAKNDPTIMKEAIDAGLSPIGARFFNQDISSLIETPNLTPGRSWTAKLLGGLVGEVSPKAGESVKRAIDTAGNFWHNTLLWDRVADLQMGLYVNLRDHAIANGMDPKGAQAMAAHMANRYAGALPMESMGNMARKMANVTMFSRSFTIGNLGVMKDILKGLPSDVKAQLERDIGETETKKVSNATRRKALAIFALDIGLMYAANSVLQDTLDVVMRDSDIDQISKGYLSRWHKLMKKFDESPWDLLNLPADMHTLSSTSSNEPGKENRILFSQDPKTGTAYYMRMPIGKIGEEFEGWVSSPLEMARKKTSTLISPLIDIYKNEDYSGHPIYDKDARGVAGAAENIGKAVVHLMEAQIPKDSLLSAYNLLTGDSNNKDLDYMKSFGPLAGVTFSKGYPGGPEAGILASASKRQEAEISEALPKIKEAVEDEKEEKAREIMDKLNMTHRQQQSLINHYRNPAGKVNSRSLQKFERIATPEEKELMEEQQ